MALFENFPYTNLHNLNLDWIIKTMRDIANQLENFSETAQTATNNINTAVENAENSIENTVNNAEQTIENTASNAEQTIEDTKDAAIIEIADMITNFSVNHRLVLIADSYGGRVDSSNTTVLQLVKRSLNLSDEDFYGSYVPGAAFAHPNVSGKFITQLESVDISDHSTVTDIVVLCGANDANYYFQDTLSAISTFYEYAKLNYPRAKVIIVGAGLTFTPDGIYIKHRATEAFIASTSFGVIYAKDSEYVLMNSYLLESDRCHPNQYGVPIVARAIANAITSYACTSKYMKTFGSATEVEYTVTPTIHFESITPEPLIMIEDDITNTRMQLINGDFDLVSANDSPLFSCRFNLNEVEFASNKNLITYELTNTLFTGKLIVNGTVLTPVGMGMMVDRDEPSNNCPCKIIFEYDGTENKYWLKFVPVAPFKLTTNTLAIYGSMSFHM